MVLCQRKYEMTDVAGWSVSLDEALVEFEKAYKCAPNILVASSGLLNQIDDYEDGGKLFCCSPHVMTELELDDGHVVIICVDDDMGDGDFKLINDPVAVISSKNYSRSDWADMVCARMNAEFQRMALGFTATFMRDQNLSH